MNDKQLTVARAALMRAIKMAGGQHALARICGGRVDQPHVHRWLYFNKKCTPAEYVLLIEKSLFGQVTRYELRPDIYPAD
jgi:DNA-binding transcriptional regulator YdaS (Cro superfamily)